MTNDKDSCCSVKLCKRHEWRMGPENMSSLEGNTMKERKVFINMELIFD